MVNTFLTYNKISQGITGETRPFKADSMHALESCTQPLSFFETERPEWAWINGEDDDE